MNRKDLPKGLKRDLFCLIGRKILDMVNPELTDENVKSNSATNLIMQSNLLSGGLQTHLYGYFTPESLNLMLADSIIGNNGDLTKHIEDALKTLKENKF